MKNISKKYVIILGIIVLGLGIFMGISYNMSGSDNRNNSNKKISIKDKKVGSISFKDISYKYDGVNTEITYNIVNNSNKKIHLDEYEITIKDSKGKLLAKIEPNYNIDLNANEKYKASNLINIDFGKDVKFEFKIKDK